MESLVLPDSYVDESARKQCVTDAGVVVHGNPRPSFSEELTNRMYNVARDTPDRFNGMHKDKTIVQIKGPLFGSKAEGEKRSAYSDFVGMTSVTEAQYALNFGMHYQAAHIPVDKDFDAKHDKTGEIMARMGQPGRLPAYLKEVIEAAKEFAQKAPPLKQLEGALKVDWVSHCGKKVARLSELEGEPLREIAQVLIEVYWKE